MISNIDATLYKPSLYTLPPIVAHHKIVIGSEASYMKEAFKMYGVMLKIAGLYPWIDSQYISRKILPHFDVNNVFVTLKLRDLHYS